eukprot:scaffold159708_cov43-Attheya_sp.AAC.1
MDPSIWDEAKGFSGSDFVSVPFLHAKRSVLDDYGGLVKFADKGEGLDFLGSILKRVADFEVELDETVTHDV